MTDSVESHVTATPADCERVFASLKNRPEGVSRSNLSYFTGLSRVLVDSALEQMERRGAVISDGALWRVKVRS